MKNWRKMLAGDDLRSIGKAGEVVAAIRSQKEFDNLFPLIFSDDRVVGMRAADIIEKITLPRPALLSKYKKEILLLMQDTIHKELKWHIALLLPRLSLNKSEQQRAWTCLVNWLQDKKESKIVRVNSLQALYEMKQKFNLTQTALLHVLKSLQDENAPSIQARLKKLQRIKSV